MWVPLTFLPHSQEEERERRMDYVPEESAVNTEIIEACVCVTQLLPLTLCAVLF